ncbi:MAG: CopG family transcriptional regulator [Oscillospiraceae bacterium]
MTDPKLEIIPKKYSGESTVISMRITKAMLADIDKIAAETGRTRNELMTLGLEFALKHIEIIDK